MHICTMCGHFDHKTDGNIVYGNQTCGEICGYPFCKEKFTLWIPVSERLPENDTAVIVATDNGMVFQCLYAYDGWDLWDGYTVNITHWMPLPEPPKEE